MSDLAQDAGAAVLARTTTELAREADAFGRVRGCLFVPNASSGESLDRQAVAMPGQALRMLDRDDLLALTAEGEATVCHAAAAQIEYTISI
jgi:hypothetical protein